MLSYMEQCLYTCSLLNITPYITLVICTTIQISIRIPSSEQQVFSEPLSLFLWYLIFFSFYLILRMYLRFLSVMNVHIFYWNFKSLASGKEKLKKIIWKRHVHLYSLPFKSTREISSLVICLFLWTPLSR